MPARSQAINFKMADDGEGKNPVLVVFFSSFHWVWPPVWKISSFMKFPLFFENIFTLFAFINDFKGSRRSKRRLPSMAELINKSKEFLGVGQRKRRAQHFEFSTDPLTGFRSNTGTYSKRSRKERRQRMLTQLVKT